MAEQQQQGVQQRKPLGEITSSKSNITANQQQPTQQTTNRSYSNKENVKPGRSRTQRRGRSQRRGRGRTQRRTQRRGRGRGRN
jgi:hypothetical protein